MACVEYTFIGVFNSYFILPLGLEKSFPNTRNAFARLFFFTLHTLIIQSDFIMIILYMCKVHPLH
jgi:hypothetical protein